MFTYFEKDKTRLPIKIWQEDISSIEAECLQQAINLSNLPFAFSHIALMPDTHSGYGMPIGGVLATKNYIIPNAVGVDIGCGMIFCQTNIKVEHILTGKTNDDSPLLNAILGNINRIVPVGFSHHKDPQEWIGFETAPEVPIIKQQLEKARYQLGTLGGGNHFIELQADESDNLCIMIHSGSRNFGKQICDEYNKKAREINTKYFSHVPKEWDLAFLPIDSKEGSEYFKAMKFAQEFALQNRLIMMERIKNLIFNMIEKYVGKISKAILLEVNAHHNYAQFENHFGENVIVHRKGAISVKSGELGIIPGSMETDSFIVEGLGNINSFNSASHGAGRSMSRKKARETFKVQEMIERLEKKGIVLNTPNKEEVIDECGLAYKDIYKVINNEKDLVKPILVLGQIGVIKG